MVLGVGEMGFIFCGKHPLLMTLFCYRMKAMMRYLL